MAEPEIDELVQWALENPTSGDVFAGRRRMRDHFGVSEHLARKASSRALEHVRHLIERPGGAQDPIGLMRELGRLRKDLTKYKEMEGVYADIVKEQMPLSPYDSSERELPEQKEGKQECVMMLDGSDWQVGMDVRPEEAMYVGGYNWEVFEARLRHLRDVILTVHDEQRRIRPVRTLVVNLLGDLLEGTLIYKGQAWFTDLELQEQFFRLLDKLTFFLRDLSRRFDRVLVFAVWGNHGRIGRKGETKPRTNAEYMLLRELQVRTRHIEGLRINVSECPLLAYELMDEVHLLAHGDKTIQWMQTPFYGMTRDTLRYIALTELPVRYAHYGHHHRNANWRESARELLMNGSLCGPSVHSMYDLKSAEPASQNLFVAHPEHGLNWRLPITFDKRREIIPGADGTLTPVHSPEDVADPEEEL